MIAPFRALEWEHLPDRGHIVHLKSLYKQRAFGSWSTESGLGYCDVFVIFEPKGY